MTTEANLWRCTAGAPMEAVALAGDLTADVVVIGGGFTGTSAALHLAEAGAKVCLLEGDTVGHGGSGRNVGLVNAGLWLPPDDVEARLGNPHGRRVNETLAAGPELVFRLIQRHGIRCEATRNGTLHCAHAPSGVADLRNRHAQQVARNAPVQWLDADQTARRTGARTLHGALFDPRAGTIQPLAYVRGLARAAIAAGAVLHEHSPVSGCVHDGAAWRVATPQGSVTARTLIQATNAYERREQHPAAFTILHFFQCATGPLDARLRDRILAGGEGCWDTAAVMSSFRMDAAGRLIVGAVGKVEGWGGAIHRHWARRKMAGLFPAAAGQPLEHAWCGRIALTENHLPKVVDTGANAIAIYGYSGRGIAPGTVFGKAAASWAQSGDPACFPVAIERRSPARLAALKSILYECGATVTHLLRARGVPRE